MGEIGRQTARHTNRQRQRQRESGGERKRARERRSYAFRYSLAAHPRLFHGRAFRSINGTPERGSTSGFTCLPALSSSFAAIVLLCDQMVMPPSIMNAESIWFRVEGLLALIGSVASAVYGGTSLIRSNSLLGPYGRTVSRALWWSWGGAVSYERCIPVLVAFHYCVERLAGATCGSLQAQYAGTSPMKPP